jgi:hypothetical protein
MRLLFVLLLLFSASANAICVNTYVCNNGQCQFIDVCDSPYDSQSTGDQVNQDVYGTPNYGTYEPDKNCESKLVNGQLITICR